MSDHVDFGPILLGCVPTLPAFCSDGRFMDQFEPELFPFILTLRVMVEAIFVFVTAEVSGHSGFDMSHCGFVATMLASVFPCIGSGNAGLGQRCCWHANHLSDGRTHPCTKCTTGLRVGIGYSVPEARELMDMTAADLRSQIALVEQDLTAYRSAKNAGQA